ncbi:MAG: TIGR03808 family TAT-translocated repetitive protein [Bosea sp. (in: a-proteobacteria)]
MALSRRDALKMALFGTLATCAFTPQARARTSALGGYGLDATTLGLRPGAIDDQTRMLAAALNEAAKRQMPLILPPGRYAIAGLSLPDGARLIGVPGATQLVAAQAGPMIIGSKLRRLALSGLSIDGLMLRQAERSGLIYLEDVAEAALDEISVTNGGAIGISLLRSGGRVERSSLTMIKDTGLLSMDAKGLMVEANRVEDCGDNGLQIWRSGVGDDGSIVKGNRISRIRNDSGGTGQYGNGISIFRAGGTIVEGNVVRDCAYSFIRNNAGPGGQVMGNNGQRCGETGIFIEFGFEGAVVANNRLEDVANGISITNLDQGGRLAVCSGNMVRRCKRGLTPRTGEVTGGVGIHAEADSTISGNVVEGAEKVGISLGWGWAMRNIAATGNMVRETDVGIGVSVAGRERNVVVSGNIIAGARRGAVMGLDHGRIVTGDLNVSPDKRADGVRIEGNRAG